MKKIFLIIFFIIFSSLNVNAWISVNPSSSITPSVKIEGNLFTFLLPNLTINSPINATYLQNHSVPLNYSVSLADSVWYSLDGGDNITSVLGLGLNNSLSNQTFFANSTGSHTLYVYANNTAGLTMRSVNFSIDTSLFVINSSEWKSFQISTNFSVLSFQEIQNLSNITLEHSAYGKIQFNERVNMTKDEDTTDNEVDLDEYINISSNRIEINSTALPNFDKAATLWLYGLTLTDPRILIDGEACPSSTCKEESYSGGTLKFNVTGFTVYSAEETPVTTPTTVTVSGSSTGGSGGGSSGTMWATDSFSIDKETIHLPITQGSVERGSFIVANNKDTSINLSIEETKLSDFVLLKEKSFILLPKESKEISFDIIAREDTVPNLYGGKLIIRDRSFKKEILVLIEVESRGALLDMKLEIPTEYLHVSPGEDILTTLILYNLGIGNEKDITLEYIIRNEEGNDIIMDTETVAIETQMSVVKRVSLPNDINTGKYILYVKSTYDGKTASASALFEIEEKSNKELLYSLLVVILIAFIAFLIVYYTRKRTLPQRIIKKVGIHDIISKKR